MNITYVIQHQFHSDFLIFMDILFTLKVDDKGQVILWHYYSILLTTSKLFAQISHSDVSSKLLLADDSSTDNLSLPSIC